MVNLRQWRDAQTAERKQHTYTWEEGFEHYRDSYRQYLKYTGGSFDLEGRKVVEVGPADFSALMYCHNYSSASVIEPMPSDILSNWVKGLPTTKVKLFDIPAEVYLDIPSEVRETEVWLFNVLQHTQDPAQIIGNCKGFADIIRFFEPVNYPTDECHLWEFTMEMFREWFGDCAKHYPSNPDARNFHTHECAYGCWIKKEEA